MTNTATTTALNGQLIGVTILHVEKPGYAKVYAKVTNTLYGEGSTETEALASLETAMADY